MTYKTFLEALEDRYLLAVTSSAAEPIAAPMSSATLSLAPSSDHVLPGVDQPVVPVNRAPDHNAGWLGTAPAMEPPPIPAAVAPAPDPGRQFASDLLFSHFVTNHESFANGAVFAPQFVAQSLREASSRPAMSLTGALLEFDAGTILIRYLSPSMEGASALRKESAARSLGTARNTGTALSNS